MNKKKLIFKIFIFILGMCFAMPFISYAEGTLIILSSAAFDTGVTGDFGRDTVIDKWGNFIFTGDSDNNYNTFKYDSDMNFISSATFNSAGGSEQSFAVTSDSLGNIIVTGVYESHMFTIKYSSSFVVISSITFHGGTWDSPNAIETDSNDNIVVGGQTYDGSDSNFTVIKYDPALSVILSSASFDRNNKNDAIRGMDIDSDDNIIVTGDPVGLCYTIKYSSNLVVLSTAAYNSAGNDYGRDVVADSLGNIYVADKADSVHVLKYDSSLNLLDSVTLSSFDVRGMAVDSNGNVTVGGQNSSAYYTIKLDGDLDVIASHTFSSAYGNGGVYDIEIDTSGNMFALGYIDVDPGSNNYDYLAVKYNAQPPVISDIDTSSGKRKETLDIIVSGSGFYDGITASFNTAGMTVNSAAVSVNHSSVAVNITINDFCSPGIYGLTLTNTDTYSDTINNVFTVECGTPAYSSVDVTSVSQGRSAVLTIAASNIFADSSVAISAPGIILNSYRVSADTVSIIADVSVDFNCPVGFYDITIENVDGSSFLIKDAFEIKSAVQQDSVIDKEFSSMLTLEAEKGDVVINIPANTFASDTTMTVAVAPVEASDRAALKKTDIGIDIRVSSGEQPTKNMTVKVNYRDADIAGLDESKLSLCRYDAVNSRWITLPTTVYADNNYLIATIDHLSKFGVMQLSALANLSEVKVFPNPYSPAFDGNLTFDNLTVSATIKIYTLAGVLVKELIENDGNGRSQWDGKNDSGETVASGIYLAYISSSVGDKIVKIAVVK